MNTIPPRHPILYVIRQKPLLGGGLLLLSLVLALGCDDNSDSARSSESSSPATNTSESQLKGDRREDIHEHHADPNSQAMKHQHHAQGSATTGHQHHALHQTQELPAAEALQGASLFQLETEFENQEGERLQLKSLRGTPVFVAMAYTHCQHACPRIISDMKAIQRALGKDANARFVLISLDPERDTVERLAAFAKQAGLQSPTWSLLRTENEDVREVAAVLGVQYRPEPPSDFAHSNLITLLDAEGVIQHRQEGLGADIQQSISALRQLP